MTLADELLIRCSKDTISAIQNIQYKIMGGSTQSVFDIIDSEYSYFTTRDRALCEQAVNLLTPAELGEVLLRSYRLERLKREESTKR